MIKTFFIMLSFTTVLYGQGMFPQNACWQCTGKKVLSYTLLVSHMGTNCDFKVTATTVGDVAQTSVAVIGGGFNAQNTSLSDRVTVQQTISRADGTHYSVESGHAAGFSLGEGCRACCNGVYDCSVDTRGVCDSPGGNNGGGGTLPPPKRKREDVDCRSPIVLDLDRNNFHFSGEDHAVTFDIMGDGDPLRMAWTSRGEGDAFLAMDFNGNGLVDDGSELFGNGTIMVLEGSQAPNGFVALSQYDDPILGGNDDGILSEADEAWSQLFLWTDNNSDAICSQGEVAYLDEFSISSLEIIPSLSSRVDQHGNNLKFFADALANGRKIKMVDVFFRVYPL